MKHRSLLQWFALVIATSVIACGGGGSNNASSGAAAFADAPSVNPDCSSLRGVSALYFDYESGLLTLVPFSPLLPSIAGIVDGGDGSIWTYPSGYSAQTLQDGVLIERNDRQVLFRHGTGSSPLDAPSLFNEQLNRVLGTLQLDPAAAVFVCGRDVFNTVSVLPDRLISGYYQVGTHTVVVRVRVISGGVSNSVATRAAAGPSIEFEQLSRDLFLPLAFSQSGGSTTLPECSDGEDNDGDMATDFLFDEQCSGLDDPDESN